MKEQTNPFPLHSLPVSATIRFPCNHGDFYSDIENRSCESHGISVIFLPKIADIFRNLSDPTSLCASESKKIVDTPRQN